MAASSENAGIRESEDRRGSPRLPEAPHRDWLTTLQDLVIPREPTQRFAAIGLLAPVVDIVVFQALFRLGLTLAEAHIASFVVAVMSRYLFDARWRSAQPALAPDSAARRHLRLAVVCMLALFLRAGVLSVATDSWGFVPQTAIFFGVAASAVVISIGCALCVFPAAAAAPDARWRVIAAAAVLYVLALRLAYLAAVDLLPEEAYYWNYAQHLDFGYLDHPPMVAWLIWAATSLLHDGEFAVRLGAYLCWIVAAGFCFELTRNLYGRTAAYVAVLLCASLPFFFAVGMVMTPDAPVTAAWAGALYFFERALLGGRRDAWWGVGIGVGLGLLSKYTIALLGPTALLFLILDPKSRHWLRRPSPYAALLVALLLFSPVILWNAAHDWASFLFQGPQRWQSPVRFSLPSLLASIVVLLTPVGLGAIVSLPIERAGPAPQVRRAPEDRRALFVGVFTLAPLSVFLVFSFFHQVKLDWTGPLWLAVIPALAARAVRQPGEGPARPNLFDRAWGPTAAIMLVAFGAVLHYLSLGLPGVGYGADLSTLPVAWKEFGRQVASIERKVESATGEKPLRVGMDRYFLSSEMAFYDPADRDGASHTAGRSLFGHDSLMYERWLPARRQQGRTVILFALDAADLAGPAVATQFSRLDPVREQVVYKKSVPAGRFYYRVGYNYHSS